MDSGKEKKEDLIDNNIDKFTEEELSEIIKLEYLIEENLTLILKYRGSNNEVNEQKKIQ